MRLLKYGAILLVVFASTYVFGWLPDRLLHPIRKHEVNAPYHAYNYGPSGLDDAIQGFMLGKPERYAGTLLYMLRTSEQGSQTQKSALFFMEFVINEPGVRSFLGDYAESLPESSERNFIETILKAPHLQSSNANN